MTEEKLNSLCNPPNMNMFEGEVRRLTPEQAVQLCRRMTKYIGVWKKYPYAEHVEIRREAGVPDEVNASALSVLRQKLTELLETQHGVFYKLGMDGKSYFFDRRTAKPIVVFHPEPVTERM